MHNFGIDIMKLIAKGRASPGFHCHDSSNWQIEPGPATRQQKGCFLSNWTIERELSGQKAQAGIGLQLFAVAVFHANVEDGGEPPAIARREAAFGELYRTKRIRH